MQCYKKQHLHFELDVVIRITNIQHCENVCSSFFVSIAKLNHNMSITHWIILLSKEMVTIQDHKKNCVRLNWTI